MIIVNGKELGWKEGLTIQDLALETGGAPGASFASVSASFASNGLAGPASTGAGQSGRTVEPAPHTTPRARLVSRLDWPVTQVRDEVTIRFIVIPSGG